MVLENFTGFFVSLGGVSLSEARSVIEPLAIFIIGIVIYSVFVYKFYKFIARRDFFKFSSGEYHKHAGLRKIGFILEYVFLFPILSFLWFFVLSVVLAMISEVVIIEDIFVISMAVLGTVRITAYYNEDLSREIAKLLPLTMLAILLLDITTLSLSTPFNVLSKIPSLGRVLLYYFGFIIGLELLIRIVSKIISKARGSGKKKRVEKM